MATGDKCDANPGNDKDKRRTVEAVATPSAPKRARLTEEEKKRLAEERAKVWVKIFIGMEEAVVRHNEKRRWSIRYVMKTGMGGASSDVCMWFCECLRICR